MLVDGLDCVRPLTRLVASFVTCECPAARVVIRKVAEMVAAIKLETVALRVDFFMNSTLYTDRCKCTSSR